MILSEDKLKIDIILNELLHCRYGTIEEIEDVIKRNNKVKNVALFKEEKIERVGDDNLIGRIKLQNNKLYDIDIYYILDNESNMYITEVDALEEVE